jgi:hypothetical protein
VALPGVVFGAGCMFPADHDDLSNYCFCVGMAQERFLLLSACAGRGYASFRGRRARADV